MLFDTAGTEVTKPGDSLSAILRNGKQRTGLSRRPLDGQYPGGIHRGSGIKVSNLLLAQPRFGPNQHMRAPGFSSIVGSGYNQHGFLLFEGRNDDIKPAPILASGVEGHLSGKHAV